MRRKHVKPTNRRELWSIGHQEGAVDRLARCEQASKLHSTANTALSSMWLEMTRLKNVALYSLTWNPQLKMEASISISGSGPGEIQTPQKQAPAEKLSNSIPDKSWLHLFKNEIKSPLPRQSLLTTPTHISKLKELRRKPWNSTYARQFHHRWRPSLQQS